MLSDNECRLFTKSRDVDIQSHFSDKVLNSSEEIVPLGLREF